MKKLLYIFASALLITSCSVDKDETFEDAQNLAYQTVDENSNVGSYKGVFTTDNSEFRATVEINVPFGINSQESIDQHPTAILKLQTGDVVFAKANKIIKKDTQITNLVFTAQDLSLTFSVNADGTNPIVSNVVYRNIESSVLIAKHTLRAPVIPITGTYNCVTCGTHPTMNTGVTQTFNVLSITDIGGGTSSIDSQLNLNGTTFTGTGTQDDCNANGVLTTCEVYGAITVPNNPDVSWDGIHNYNNEATGANDCSDFEGTWSWNSTSYGTLSGTFTNDEDCTPPVVLYENNFDAFDGSGFSPTPTAGQLDSNIIIVVGASDGDLNYGDTGTTGDFARGADVGGGVGTGGVYSFDIGVGNNTLGLQPGAADFTPGYIEFRIQNLNAETYTEIDLNADLWVNNDENRSLILTLEYSTDGTTFVAVPGNPTEVTQEVADANGFEMDALIDKTITGLNIATNDFIYFRVSTDDNTGSGARDEIAIDNLVIAGIE